MGIYSSNSQTCYRVRALLPIVHVVREGKYGSAVIDAGLAWLDSLGPDERVPILTWHALFELVTSITKDTTIGVRAAARAGRGGAFGLLCSRETRTVHSAIEQAGKHLRLLNEASSCILESRRGSAVVHLVNRYALAEQGEDYQTCGLLAHLKRGWPPDLEDSLDVWFRHSEPSDLTEYRKLFKRARFYFEAGESGFSVPARALDNPWVAPRRQNATSPTPATVSSLSNAQRARH